MKLKVLENPLGGRLFELSGHKNIIEDNAIPVKISVYDTRYECKPGKFTSVSNTSRGNSGFTPPLIAKEIRTC